MIAARLVRCREVPHASAPACPGAWAAAPLPSGGPATIPLPARPPACPDGVALPSGLSPATDRLHNRPVRRNRSPLATPLPAQRLPWPARGLPIRPGAQDHADREATPSPVGPVGTPGTRRAST